MNKLNQDIEDLISQAMPGMVKSGNVDEAFETIKNIMYEKSILNRVDISNAVDLYKFKFLNPGCKDCKYINSQRL